MTAEWLCPAWLEQAPNLPRFRVLDTRSAQGVLDNAPKTVTVSDLVRFHGHACDGLVRAAYAFRALFDAMLGPDEPIDRTDLLVVSKNSPCLGDVAAYLTGGRVRFGSHRLDAGLGVGFVVQRMSDAVTFEVREEAGFFPPLIAKWETALLRDDLDEGMRRELIAVNEATQWDWVRDHLLPTLPSEHYHVRSVASPALPDPLMTDRRTDIVNRTAGLASDATGGGPAATYWRDLYARGPEALRSVG